MGASGHAVTETRGLSIDLDREAPNVVTELQFKVLLRKGYRVEIIARGDPEKRGAFWYGDWIIAVVNEDRSAQKILVPARSRDYDEEEIRFREFKTANGLLSFMHKFGFPAVSIPMVAGGRTLHERPPRPLGGGEAKDS